MGTVIDLTAWRDAQRDADAASSERLERAMGFLQAQIDAGMRLGARHETELLAIVGALSLGLVDEAAARIERLSERAAHPAGSNR